MPIHPLLRYLSRHRFSCLAAPLVGLLLLALCPPQARAIVYYWDVNGTATAGFGGIDGGWNGTNAFWNTSSIGGAGTTTALPTNADDLLISGGAAGTITVTGARVASSLTFSANVATTVSGGTSLTIGGTGTSSGILANSSAASVLSTPLILNSAVSAFNFSNSGAGLLTIGATTGAASSGTQFINVGSGSTGGITLNGVIGNGAGGGNVGLVIDSSGSGITTISGANTFTGGVSIRSGTVTVSVSNSGTTNGAFGPSSVAASLGHTSGSANAMILSGNTISNPITVVAGSTGNTLTLGNSTATNGATFSGAITMNHDLNVVAQGTGSVTLSGALSGSNHLLISGTGNATVSGTGSTYTGNLQFTATQLTLNDASALGGNGGSFIFSGQRIDNTSQGTVTLTSTKTKAWNSDFTYLSSRNLVFGSGAVTLGGNRRVTVNTTLNGNTLTEGGAIGDGGNGYSLTKTGAGALTLTGASTYTGATVVNGGTLNVNGASGALSGTSGVTVAGGTLAVGVGSGVGVANRINSAAGLTLGGSGGNGSLQILAGATGPLNSQAFSSLSVAAGSHLLSSNSTSNAGTLSFTGAGASVYSRSVGGVVRFQALASSGALFVNAPTGSSVIGTGTGSILIGAVSGTGTNLATDFVRAAAGALSAPVYINNEWASGNNTTVTLSRTIAADSTTQSLRFNDNVVRTVTLSGTNTIESGGILVSSSANGTGDVGTPQTITGGTLQAANGQDLWVYTAGTTATDLIIASQIGNNGGSSLTKGGNRTLYLTNASNSYAGGTFLNEGTLNITSGGALGAVSGALTFGGAATLQAGAANVDLGARAITIAGVQNALFDTAGNAINSSGVISGTAGLTKISNGTLTLSGASTYTGTTNVQQGTLRLDFNAAGAPVTNILSGSSTLITGQYVNSATANSATLQILGADNAASVQTFNGLVIGRGAGHLNLTAGTGTGTLVVNLGSILRNTLAGVADAAAPQGSTLDIKLGAGVTVTGSGNTANGLLLPSGHAAMTVNGNTWATLAGGNVVGYTGYTTTVGAAANLDVSGAAMNINIASVHTLRFNAGAASTLNLTSGAVRQISTGGILVTGNVGANLSTIGTGLLAGAGRRDLIIHQHNLLGDLQIDATIVDFQGGAQVNTKSGAGKLILTASNTNTGPTYINEGTVVVTGDVIAAPTGITGSTSGSSTTVNVSSTAGLFIGQSVSGNATYFPATSGGVNATYTIVAIDSGNSTITLSTTTSGGAMLAGTALNFGGGGGLGTGAVAHVVASGAELHIGNGGTTGALFTGQTVTNNGKLLLNRSNDFTFNNVVSGVGSFEKQGAGNVTVSGANSFTGESKISGGSVIMAHASALGTGTLDYNSYGGTLSFGTLTAATLGGLKGNQNLALTNVATTPAAVALTVGANHQSTTYSGDLGGLGSLVKNGGGTLTLSGDNTYAGNTTLNHGGLTISGTHTANGAFTVNNAGVLAISGDVTGTGAYTVNGGTFNLTGTVTGAGHLTIGTTTLPSTVNVSGDGSYLSAIGKDVYLGTTVAGSVGVLNVTDNGEVKVSHNGANNGSIQLGNIAGASGVINQSGGIVSLESNIVFGSAGSGAASAYGFYNQSGGQLLHNGGTTTGARFRIGNAAGSNIGMYYLSGGSATYTNGNNSIEVGGSGTFVTGSNAIGVLYVSGTGTMTGSTASLQVANQNASGTGTATAFGQVTIGGAGSTSAGITVASVNTSSNNASQPGTSIINLLGGGTLTTGNITKSANGTSALNFNGGTLKVSTTATSIASTISVYSHSGGATIDTNSLNYTVNGPILAPTGSGVASIAIANGGTDYAGAPAVMISGGTGTGATAVATMENGVVTGIVITNPGTGYAPDDVLSVSLSGGAALTPATVGTISLATNISGGLIKNNAGTLTLRGANTYTGPTTINGGTLALSTGGSLADSTAVNMTASGAGFDISAITAGGETVGSLAGVAGSTVTLGSKVLTVGGNNATTTFAGSISGAGGLTKTGTGIMTLSGSNGYAGTTTVSGGSLNVGNGGTTGTGAVNVSANATLLGTGTVQGSSFTLANDATLRAGATAADTSLGTLTFTPATTGAYNLASGSTIVLGLTDASNHDLLVFNGTSGSTLTFSGKLVVEDVGFVPAANQLYKLIDWSALVTADFAGFNVGTNLRDGADDDASQFNLPNISGSGYVWDVSTFTTNGTLSLAAIPEPSRAVLMLGGLMLLATRRRRVKCEKP